MIFAVDFDGTLCRDAWPDIGEPNEALIRFLITARSIGDKVILNTLREEDDLTAAISWCHEKGLSFDAVNDNLRSLKKNGGIIHGRSARTFILTTGIIGRRQ